jgi:hypothetical protein
MQAETRVNAEKASKVARCGSLPVRTETEIRQFVAFLESLTDTEFAARPELSDPRGE